MPGPIDDRVTGKNYKSGWGVTIKMAAGAALEHEDLAPASIPKWFRIRVEKERGQLNPSDACALSIGRIAEQERDVDTELSTLTARNR
jgi:hypothetical protein